jgi:hypothetical protein
MCVRTVSKYCTVHKSVSLNKKIYFTQANYLLLGAGEEAMDFLGKFMIFRNFLNINILLLRDIGIFCAEDAQHSKGSQRVLNVL